MQDLFLQLFNKDYTDTGSEDMLLEITKKYPYFSPAHFFLLKKTGNTGADYDKIAAKTALHFNNPFLLNYRMAAIDKAPGIEKTETIENIKSPEESQKSPEVAPVESNGIVENVQPMEEEKDLPVENEKTGEPKKEEMIFEPLFASDYFASQGIKLSEDVQPADKLGKQLKSFTEWLKSMKKVHESKLPVGNEQIDLAVQNLAEKSNQEDDVITESMAEAYLQQGKLKKARETLEKLSLLNPAKSAYFAAKIENIHSGQ